MPLFNAQIVKGVRIKFQTFARLFQN